MSNKLAIRLTAFFIAIAMCVSINSSYAQSKKAKTTTTKKSNNKRGGGSYAIPNTSNSTETYNGHEVFTGPRGGKYYINKNGNKTYIKH